MKKTTSLLKIVLLAGVLGVLAVQPAAATLTKVMAGSFNGTTNSTAVSGSQATIPTANYIVDTTGPNTNILQVTFDGSNYFNLATNVATTSGVTSYQPAIPLQTPQYRVQIITTNAQTNVVYFNL